MGAGPCCPGPVQPGPGHPGPAAGRRQSPGHVVCFFIEATRTPQRVTRATPRCPPGPALGPASCSRRTCHSGVLFLTLKDQRILGFLGFFLWRSGAGGLSGPLPPSRPVLPAGHSPPRPSEPVDGQAPEGAQSPARPDAAASACLESTHPHRAPLTLTGGSPTAPQAPQATGLAPLGPACLSRTEAAAKAPAAPGGPTPPSAAPRPAGTQLLDHALEHLVLLLLPETERGPEGRLAAGGARRSLLVGLAAQPGARLTPGLPALPPADRPHLGPALRHAGPALTGAPPSPAPPSPEPRPHRSRSSSRQSTMSLRWFTVLTYCVSRSCSRCRSWGDFRPSAGTACGQREPRGPAPLRRQCPLPPVSSRRRRRGVARAGLSAARTERMNGRRKEPVRD